MGQRDYFPIEMLIEDVESKKTKEEKLKDNVNWLGIPKYNELGRLNPAYMHYNDIDPTAREELIRNQIRKGLGGDIADTFTYRPNTQFFDDQPNEEAAGAFVSNIDDYYNALEGDFTRTGEAKPRTFVHTDMHPDFAREVVSHELGHLISMVGADDGEPGSTGVEGAWKNESIDSGQLGENLTIDQIKAHAQNKLLRDTGVIETLKEYNDKGLDGKAEKMDDQWIEYILNDAEPIARMYQKRLEDIALRGNKGSASSVEFLPLNYNDDYETISPNGYGDSYYSEADYDRNNYGTIQTNYADAVSYAPELDAIDRGWVNDPTFNIFGNSKQYYLDKRKMMSTPDPNLKEYKDESGINILQDKKEYEEIKSRIENQESYWRGEMHQDRSGYIPNYEKGIIDKKGYVEKYNPYIDADIPSRMTELDKIGNKQINEELLKSFMYQIIQDRKNRGIKRKLPTVVGGGV